MQLCIIMTVNQDVRYCKANNKKKGHFIRKKSKQCERPFKTFKYCFWLACSCFLSPQEEPYAMSRGSELEGYCIDLIAELSKKLGFKCTVHLVKDSRYGLMDSSGNWNGMIGEIMRGVSHRSTKAHPACGCVCV